MSRPQSRSAVSASKYPPRDSTPARAARAPPTSRTAAPAKRLPRPNRGAPPRAGTCVPRSPRPAAQLIPGTPPEGAAARAPPRASRKRAQMPEHWCRLPRSTCVGALPRRQTLGLQGSMNAHRRAYHRPEGDTMAARGGGHRGRDQSPGADGRAAGLKEGDKPLQLVPKLIDKSHLCSTQTKFDSSSYGGGAENRTPVQSTFLVGFSKLSCQLGFGSVAPGDPRFAP